MTKLDIKYAIEGEEADNKINECSWVAVLSETDKDSQVVFYNFKGNLEESINSFEEFFEVAKEFISLPKADDLVVKNHEGKTTSAFYATGTTVIQDYEEYSGKEIDVPIIKSVVVDCYNGGITLDQIPNLIAQTEKTVDCLDNDELSSVQESLKEDKDPYVRYGIPKGFM